MKEVHFDEEVVQICLFEGIAKTFEHGQVEGVQEVGAELFARLLGAASGEATCSEKLDIGDEEFVPWLVGPLL